MATDPVPSLLATAKQTPDPRAVMKWIDAYLGTRPHDAKLSVLKSLEQTFTALARGTDAKAAGLVLRMIQRTHGDLAAKGARKK